MTNKIMKNEKTLVMGAVAYAPKVVTIWEGFKEYFFKRGLEFDYILYSNYERQVEAQFAGAIDVAWNSPLAWVRARRMAKARGLEVSAIAMRDSDRDLASVLVVKSASGISKLQQLEGRTVGFGAVDSPQASLIPLEHMRHQGLHANRNFTKKHFDVLAGKHGDHIGGERDAAIALISGEIDAAWMIDANYLAFSKEGTLPAGATQIIARTENYDHCNFTLSPHAVSGPKFQLANQFTDLLFAMKWEDSEVRPLLELEGLRAWLPGRTDHYAWLENAVDNEKFYDEQGRIVAENYRY